MRRRTAPRRTVLNALVGALALTASIGGWAQPAKVYRVGALSPGGVRGLRHDAQLVSARPPGLGVIVGTHYSFEYRFADGQAERLPGLAAELVNMNVDVIWAV